MGSPVFSLTVRRARLCAYAQVFKHTGLMYEFEVETVSMLHPLHHNRAGQDGVLRLNIIVGCRVLARQAPRRATCKV